MKWLKDYFDLTRREETGIISLAAMIVLLFILQFLWPMLIPPHKTDFSDLQRLAGQLATDSTGAATDADSSINKANLFAFDPNTLDEKGFARLGLSGLVIDHIVHYRQKGGHFFHPEDLGKVYGITPSDLQALKPYIVINNEHKKAVIGLVDINIADSATLMTVKGIGPVFAYRILSMRRRLGSFADITQLKDVYGIDDEKFNFIRPQVCMSTQPLHIININTATIDELKTNPYLRYKLASAIVGYRTANGLFRSVEDLKKIYAIDAATYGKLRPYITVK